MLDRCTEVYKKKNDELKEEKMTVSALLATR
jgi:hypothetical protein